VPKLPHPRAGIGRLGRSDLLLASGQEAWGRTTLWARKNYRRDSLGFVCFSLSSRFFICAKVIRIEGAGSSVLRIIGTLKRSFGILKEDPILIVPFVLPAIFPIEGILANFLSYYLTVSIMGDSAEVPSMPPVPLVALYFIVGFFLGAWASAAAILKVRQLEGGNKLGLKEALSEGLKKVPRLLVPALAGLALYALMIASMTTAIIPYILTGMPSPAQDAGPSVIVLQVAIGLLLVVTLYVATRLRLSAPACVLENSYGFKTSWRLVRGNWWKLFAILLVFGMLSALISRIPTAGVFLRGLLVEPITVAAMTLVYFQLR
jgi:hypothetical protein